ncbi:MAG: response regulator [Nitrosopumilus sp.]|nr:response regulator [Nitrosopumilus sp.]
MKVLLIDDNIDLLTMLSRVLSVKIQEIKIVDNGKEGLELIKNEEWDLILLDLSMPNVSGLDVIEDLEKNNLLKKNTIWIFTASSITDKEERELLNRGVSDVVRKPVKAKDLFAKMAELKTA